MPAGVVVAEVLTVLVSVEAIFVPVVGVVIVDRVVGDAGIAMAVLVVVVD